MKMRNDMRSQSVTKGELMPDLICLYMYTWFCNLFSYFCWLEYYGAVPQIHNTVCDSLSERKVSKSQSNGWSLQKLINKADHDMHSFNKSDFDSNYTIHQFVFITSSYHLVINETNANICSYALTTFHKRMHM